MKRELGSRGEDTAEVGIVEVHKSQGSGRAFVKFEKVWEATGCEIALNGEKLFGRNNAVFVARVLEDDLPDSLKKYEAWERVKAREARAKNKKKSKKEEEEEAEEYED